MDEQRIQSVLYAGVTALIVAVGGWSGVRPGGSALWADTLVVLGILFFGLSALPRVRGYDGYNAFGAAFAAVVCTVAYLGSSVLFVGILAVMSVIGTLVELYNWRAETEYLRI